MLCIYILCFIFACYVLKSAKIMSTLCLWLWQPPHFVVPLLHWLKTAICFYFPYPGLPCVAQFQYFDRETAHHARFMGPTWGPSGADRTQVGLMLAPWTLLSGSSLPTSFRLVALALAQAPTWRHRQCDYPVGYGDSYLSTSQHTNKELLAKRQRTLIVMNSSLVITQMIGSLSTSGVHLL